MLLKALVFRFARRVAKLELRTSGGGEPLRSADMRRALVVGGRWETQSCTSRETLGLEIRLCVFFEDGLVVITTDGEEE